MAGGVDPLLKAVTALREENAALTKRIAHLEAQPMPPKTAGPGAHLASVSKGEDTAGPGGQRAASPSTDAVAKMLAEMAPEDRTMLLTKAAHATPIAVTHGYGGAR